MKPLKDIAHIYLIGIGGIGMSALALYFLKQGRTVAGYDRTSGPITEQLSAQGINIHFEEDITAVPPVFTDHLNKDNTLIIYTPAIPSSNKELSYFLSNGYQVMKRAQVLGKISNSYRTIAVAGTHGKTTTSSMLAHLLHSSALGCNAFLGGISTNYHSNLITSATSRILVVEADEFDRSFLTLKPEIAIITSIDADHLDVYGTETGMLSAFHEFSNNITETGSLIYRFGLPFDNLRRKRFTYSLEAQSDYHAADLSVNAGQFSFTAIGPDCKLTGLRLGMPGIHNVENAVAAFAVAHRLGLSENAIRKGLADYKGVKRRFEIHINTDELVYMDDYAHHPVELNTCIRSVRQMYPGRRIKGIFQPHLYSRTRDHLSRFAQSLSLLDEVILLDIYPAREKPIEGITSEALLKQIGTKAQLLTKEQAIDSLSASNTDVLLTLGAGDIDRMVVPITEKLSMS